jgi:hypothetical protein
VVKDGKILEDRRQTPKPAVVPPLPPSPVLPEAAS